ncbi:MAG TPA: hypothetical protein DCM05_12675 [Elusimicrobia bacterium]|nr:hypothetical protein [Elusimicrobiota bacterium]
MDKATRGGMPGLSEPPLRRRALCAIAYTPEEFEVLRLGAADPNVSIWYFIFEEEGRLFFCDRAEGQVEYVAHFEPRGEWVVLHGIQLTDDEADRRAVHPGDVDAAARVWMAIERCLLRRFPEDEWGEFRESFQVTPEMDDATVAPDIYERATLFAIRAFFKKRARTL